MEENWNPTVEHIEGELCEKGLLKETYDYEKDDLVRNLTFEGRKVSEELLKDKEWKRIFLLMAKAEISKYPQESQGILWKNLINQLRGI